MVAAAAAVAATVVMRAAAMHSCGPARLVIPQATRQANPERACREAPGSSPPGVSTPTRTRSGHHRTEVVGLLVMEQRHRSERAGLVEAKAATTAQAIRLHQQPAECPSMLVPHVAKI